MTKLRFAIAVVLTISLPCLGAEQAPPWPPQEKTAAVSGCKVSILANAEAGYLARHKITREQLPPDFHQKISVALEPFLSVCDCVIKNISMVWSHEYFVSHQAELAAKTQELVNSGVCRTNPGAQPNAPADAEFTR
ncbi:hypothetical protein [Sulfurifustis variabilis]|uniref:hypothetical protein n=1 Tax=Sulfurifustis variabilis TaxID=1675686 RepID=UPI0011E4D56C|nr:hypothetical protein [Sulfurifustis variabilis]